MAKIIEEISYPNGGKLRVYEGNRISYIPSEKYKQKLEELNKKSKLTLEERIAKLKNNKNLYKKGICISGNKLIDKILRTHEIFDFSKVQL